jgi:hypothetical protein
MAMRGSRVIDQLSLTLALEGGSVASDNSMCLGSTQPRKMSTRILLGVKTAGAYG